MPMETGPEGIARRAKVGIGIENNGHFTLAVTPPKAFFYQEMNGLVSTWNWFFLPVAKNTLKRWLWGAPFTLISIKIKS